MNAWINGIGWVTPAGCGSGRDGSEQPLRPGVLEIPGRKQVFDQPDKRFGRLDDFSRVGLAALTFCLRDGGIENWKEKRSIGIVAASRYGCLVTDLAYLETVIPDGGKLASPNLFAYTLPNCFLGEAALRFGLTGNTLVLNRRDPGRLSVLRFAVEELTWSDQAGILAGICDLASPKSGENHLPGALFLLLERRPRGEKCYGELSLTGENLSFENRPVAGISDLLDACLASKK